MHVFDCCELHGAFLSRDLSVAHGGQCGWCRSPNPIAERIQELFFFFSSRRRHTRFDCDWSSDVCSSDLIRSIALVWSETVKRYFEFFTLHLKTRHEFEISKELRRELENAILNLDTMQIGRASCRERV